MCEECFKGGLRRYIDRMIEFHELDDRNASIIMRSVADERERDSQ